MKTLELIASITLFTLFCIIIFGTIGFIVFEGLSPLDAIYFVIITLSTVGYGDIYPITAIGKIFVIIIILIGVLSYLGLAATVIDVLIVKREKKIRQHRLNTITGAFFSEVGIKTLRIFLSADPDIFEIKNILHVTNVWTDQEFLKASKKLKSYKFSVNIKKIDLEILSSFLEVKRIFLLDQLELTLVLERDISVLLRAIFHLTEELTYRNNFKKLPQSDLNHLSDDIQRVYIPLVYQWVDYMAYLKNHYPFLFSLAMRTNPFDPDASPIVK